MQLRFWKRYNIDLVETLDKDIYFVDRNSAFTDDEKQKLVETVKEIDFKQNTLEGIRELFYSNKQPQYYTFQEIELNLYNDFGVIFYK